MTNATDNNAQIERSLDTRVHLRPTTSEVTMTGPSTQGNKTMLHPVSEEPAHDVGGGRLVATITDPDGNVLGLLQDG
jgi:hypothetical protein